MLNKSIGDLENEYVALFLKEPTGTAYVNPNPITNASESFQDDPDSGSVNKEYIYNFVNYMVNRKELISSIGAKIQSSYDPNTNWLSYYREKLTQEIRNIKLQQLYE